MLRKEKNGKPLGRVSNGMAACINLQRTNQRKLPVKNFTKLNSNVIFSFAVPSESLLKYKIVLSK